MTALKVSIAPAAGVGVPTGLGSFFLDAIYSRAEYRDGRRSHRSAQRGAGYRARRLDGQLHGSLDLPDVAPSSSIDLCSMGSNGGVRLRKTVVPTEAAALAVELSKDEVAAITANDPQPVPRNSRRAFFVPINDCSAYGFGAEAEVELMLNQLKSDPDSKKSSTEKNSFPIPSISLPKGGGANAQSDSPSNPTNRVNFC